MEVQHLLVYWLATILFSMNKCNVRENLGEMSCSSKHNWSCISPINKRKPKYELSIGKIVTSVRYQLLLSLNHSEGKENCFNTIKIDHETCFN